MYFMPRHSAEVMRAGNPPWLRSTGLVACENDASYRITRQNNFLMRIRHFYII
jgi:hypothetical protein